MALSKIYSEDTLASLTTVRSLDYTLASPSGVFDLSHVDWRTDDSVQWQLKFFQNAVTYLPRVKRIRLAFVRERLCPSIWNGLVELLAQVEDLQVLCLSHMRSLTEQRGPHAAPGNPFADEVLQASTHTPASGPCHRVFHCHYPLLTSHRVQNIRHNSQHSF